MYIVLFDIVISMYEDDKVEIISYAKRSYRFQTLSQLNAPFLLVSQVQIASNDRFLLYIVHPR